MLNKDFGFRVLKVGIIHYVMKVREKEQKSIHPRI